MPIAAAGDRAILVTCDAAAARAVRELPHVLACIPGHETLLVICDTTPDREAIARTIEAAAHDADRDARSHRFEIAFDGIDLDELLAHAAIGRDGFLTRVRDVRLSVRYLGFRAGFAYCDGWPEAWRMPRRATSRNVVPRGSFAIAGAMAGFYPVDSPGGWNLLGRTNATLWDPSREPPNLLSAGDDIELVPVQSVSEPPAPAAWLGRSGPPLADVLIPGQLTTIVGPRDWDRVDAGVTPGGPFDDDGAARSNRAVGNADDAPLLECVLVGPTLRFRTASRVAFCDGSLNVRQFRLREGEELAIGRFHGGLRGYLAIEGGVDERRGRWEESVVVRKGDVLTRTGSEVAKLRAAGTSQPRNLATSGSTQPRDLATRTTLRVMLGPHAGPELPTEWEVTSQINRMGMRLRPLAKIDASLPADLPSCGMQFGTLQWHPDGSLMAMGPDHPVTGGYLQPATVLSEDLWKLAQLQPGERVRLLILSREDGRP